MRFSFLFWGSLSLGLLHAQLPGGRGKDVTASVCGTCHGTDVLFAHRQGKEQWTETMLRMIQLGATATEEQLNTVLDYLTENFAPLVSINKASADALERGLGIARTDAQAIVKYREEKGAFRSVDDLKKVSGLDIKRIEAVKHRLSFQ